MNLKEFSDQFDTLLDSYKLKEKFGDIEDLYTLKLDEYEKSTYLTKAQYDLIIDLYTGRNQIGNSYEQTEELRRYLSNLNSVKLIEEFKNMGYLGLSPNSVQCSIADNNILYITQEQCLLESEDPCLNNTWLDTYPILRDEYNNLKNNPFKNKKVWRVDLGIDKVELISKFTIKGYKVSYIRKPKPIILEDLYQVSIEGINTASECELNSNLHSIILQRAVETAITYMATKFNNKE